MKVYWGLVVVVVVMVMLVLGQYAYANDLGAYAFPQKNQTPEQQKQDESTCAQWSKEKTGLDPAVLQYQQQQAMAAQQQTAQAAQQRASTSTARSLGRAALTGAALGGINNSMDDGAGKGAVMGVTLATSKAIGSSKDKQIQAAANGADAQAQQVQADSQKYMRAYCACMEGKGYSIR